MLVRNVETRMTLEVVAGVRIIIQGYAIVLGVKCYDLNDEIVGSSINKFDVFLAFNTLWQ